MGGAGREAPTGRSASTAEGLIAAFQKGRRDRGMLNGEVGIGADREEELYDSKIREGSVGKGERKREKGKSS